MAKFKIKKNDQVLVVAGKDRGARGRVLRVVPATGKALVEGVNIIKRHTRADQSQQNKGGIVEREAPIQISNLKLICPESGNPTKVGRTRLADGSGARVSKQTGNTI